MDPTKLIILAKVLLRRQSKLKKKIVENKVHIFNLNFLYLDEGILC